MYYLLFIAYYYKIITNYSFWWCFLLFLQKYTSKYIAPNPSMTFIVYFRNSKRKILITLKELQYHLFYKYIIMPSLL